MTALEVFVVINLRNSIKKLSFVGFIDDNLSFWWTMGPLNFYKLGQRLWTLEELSRFILTSHVANTASAMFNLSSQELIMPLLGRFPIEIKPEIRYLNIGF